MNKLILCEGKTDAILLSFYLGHKNQWRYIKQNKEFRIKANEVAGEFCEWYENSTDRLLICAVGGKDRFRDFFNKNIARSIIDANFFSKIAVVTDRDDRKIDAILSEIATVLAPIKVTLKQNNWQVGTYTDSYQRDETIETLALIIPTEREGALETVLLTAIAEDSTDRIIVEKSQDFIDDLRKISTIRSKYLSSERLKLKAKLSVTWSIQCPDKYFDFFQDHVSRIDWDKYQTMDQCFAELAKI